MDQYLQCEAPQISKWFITPITMVYGTQITLVTGAGNGNDKGVPHLWKPPDQ